MKLNKKEKNHINCKKKKTNLMMIKIDWILTKVISYVF